MDYTLFQKLSESELDNYITEMDLVLEFHVKWLSELNKALICQNELNFQYLKTILATDDHFSRWYNGINDDVLLEIPFFELDKSMSTLDVEQQYLLYCDRGVMSRLHAEILREKGLPNIGVYRP